MCVGLMSYFSAKT